MVCFWRVRTWDERSKVSSWSDIHRFSVGLLTDKDFPGEYIGLDKSAGDVTAPILRKRFKLRGRHRVFIHVNSLGYHEVRVNGRKVGDAVLAPAVSQLDKRSHIVTYDITSYSREGDNEVEIWLGQGWYRENLFHAEYEGPLVKAAVMRQNGAGWQPVAVTDSSWEGTPSGYHDFGTWQALQFGGERVDARILHNRGRHWTKAHVVSVADKTATPQMTEGNRIIDTLKPVSITAYDGGWLVDFGRDITGWLRLEMPDVPGDVTVRMEYGDWIDTTGVFTPQGEYDEYITAGDGKDVFCNKFHHHAFRYVLVKNIRQPRAEDLTALQISGDYAETVRFKCSDDDINSIYQMISRTMRCLTFSGYMVDCPHLERMGYGGDGNSSTMTVQTLCDVAPVYYNWLTAWGDAMAADGDLPYVAPAGGGGGGPYWNSFIIKAPLRTYLNYGDRRMLVKLYGQMKRWLGFVGRHVKDGLLQPWADTDRRMKYLKLANLQRRTTGIGYGDIASHTLLLRQIRTQVNVLGRQANDWRIQTFSLRQFGKVGQKDGRNRQLVLLAHLIAQETREIDRCLCQPQVDQFLGVQRQGQLTALTLLQHSRFGLYFQIGRQMHQDRLIRQIGKVHNAEILHRMFSAMHIRKIYFISVDEYLPHSVRMSTGKIRDFRHHFTVELQINQMRGSVRKDSYRLLKVSQGFGIEGDIHRSLVARSDRRLCPAGSRTGTIRLHLGEHQRLITRIGDSVLHSHRPLPFYLPQVLQLGTRREARLRQSKAGQTHGKSYYREKSFHLFCLYL